MTKSKENHALNVSEAVNHSAEEAIILFNLRFWLDQNKQKGRNLHDGRVWTYNSTQAFAERIPYLTKHQIYRRLKKLESKGIISTGNYNKMKYDRTKWYTINEPEYVISQGCKMEITDSCNQNDGSVKPIPDTIPDTPISKDIGVGMNTDLKKKNSFDGTCKQKNGRRVSKTGKPIEYTFWFNLFREVNDAEVTVTQKRRDMIASALQIFTEEELEDIIRFRAKHSCWEQYGPQSEEQKRSFNALFQSKEKLTQWYDKMINAKKISEKNKQFKQSEGFARGIVWNQGM